MEDVSTIEIRDQSRELVELRNELTTIFEEKMRSREKLPEIRIKKKAFGVVDPEAEVVIQPRGVNDKNKFYKLEWDLEVLGRETDQEDKTEFQVEEVNKETVGNKWPDAERKLDRDDAGYIFRDAEGRAQGFAVMSGTVDSRQKGLRWIKSANESQGWGRRMVKWLQGNYQSLDVSVDAHSEVRSYEEAQERLMKFYAKLGFCGDAAGMSWNARSKNLETADVVKGVNYQFVVSGRVMDTGKLLRLYLDKLEEEGKIEEVLGEGGAAAFESWKQIDAQIKRLDKKLEY